MATIKGWHAKVIADKVKRVFKDKGYVFFDNKKSWNVNIVGIRNASAQVGPAPSPRCCPGKRVNFLGLTVQKPLETFRREV